MDIELFKKELDELCRKHKVQFHITYDAEIELLPLLNGQDPLHMVDIVHYQD